MSRDSNRLLEWFLINRKNIVIPNIQRDFVWTEKQIELFFDSIYRGFFVGMFWTWTPTKKQAKEIEFFELPDTILVHPELNEIELPKNPIAIIDGQQRLTALSIGINGTYKNKILCFDSGHKNGASHVFKLKKIKDIEKSRWIPVKDILSQRIDTLTDSNRRQDKIRDFRTAIDKALFISYKLKGNNEIQDVVEIFRRVNKGGTPLTNSQDLMTRLSEFWKDCRREFKALQNEITTTSKGKLTITSDFIVKAALFCTSKSMKIKVTFDEQDEELISPIQRKWKGIRQAIKDMTTRIFGLGFNNSNITSYNALIPLVYTFYTKNKPSDETISKYIYRASLTKAFGKSSDSKLIQAKKIMEKGGLSKLTTTYKANETHLKEILALPKSKASKLALKLLYGYNNAEEVWHDDHMHPEAAFKSSLEFMKRIKKEKKKNPKLFTEAKGKFEIWKKKCNQLPNLQVLWGPANQKKNDESLQKWVEKVRGETEFWEHEPFLPKPRHKTKNKVQKFNLSLVNFEKFFERRKSQMKNRLKKELQ